MRIRTMASKDESYEVTGKVCPPKLPMDNVNMDNWLIIPSSLMESIFTEIPIEGTKISRSTSLCALSSQANVVLSTNGLSHSSVSLPYYFCNFCDHHTDNKAALLRHMSSKHVFKCLFCDFISFTRCGLIQHQLFKHVDAEEMQPILTTKTIQLNTSQLQRHFRYLIQFKDSCDSHSRPGAESDNPVNSSHLNTLSEAESGDNYFLSVEKKGNHTLSVRKEVSDSVTVSQAVNTTTNSAQQESLSFSSVPTMLGDEDDKKKSIAKDSHLSGKGVSDGFKASDKYKAEISNIKSVRDMPHFLDESDSSVTSSSNHQSTLSPQAHQKSGIRGLQSVYETESPIKDQVPSFLTDSLSVPKIVGEAGWKPGGSDSSHNIVKKILKWCADENSLEHCGKESKSMFNSISIDDKNNSHPAINTTTSESGCLKDALKSPENVLNNCPFEEREGSLSPNLSSLSVERLQKQLEEAVSNSPGFTFLESLKSSHSLCNNLSVATDSNASSASVSPHILTGIKQGFKCFVDDSECVKKDVDNFLLTAEDQQDSDRQEQEESQFKRRRIVDNLENKVQSPVSIKQKKIENYDLLRNLLVQKPKDTMKHFVHNPKELIRIPLSRNTSPMTSNPTMSDVALARQRTPSSLMNLRTRASDMSLKDLLIGNHPQVNSPRPAKSNKDLNPSQKNMNIFLVCGYCNFESANKVQFDAHVAMCKQINHDMKDCDSLQESADIVYDCVKQEPLDNSCGEASSSFSSGEFSASGLLKSLTAHSTIKKNASPLTAEANKSCDIFKGVARKHEIKQANHKFNSKMSSVNMFHHEFHDNEDLSANIHGIVLPKTTSLHLSPNLKNFDVESNINKGTDPVMRKRKCRHDEDLDYVYESENSSDTDSTSECEYKINSVQNHKRQERKKVKDSFERVSSGLQMVRHDVQDPLIRQPKISLACFRCNYCTENKTVMRQHLILNHPNSVPFAQAIFENKKEGLLYFCCGLNSSCTFFSIEGSEIFEHIKLCYSGLLDNFLDVSAVEYVDYSQALVSLGIAAKQLDPSPTTYYCLRCNFSQTKFQLIAYHVASNHPKNVAGVLLVNRVLADARVLMVCLSCNAHVTSKEWSVHRCRILDAETCKGNISAPCNTSITTPTTKLLLTEHKILASLENSDQGKVSLLCELMAAKKGKIVQSSNKQSLESLLLNSKIEDHGLELEMRCHSQGKSSSVEGLDIKQEIQECEDNFDVPVHFEHSVDANLDNEANSTGIHLANPENTEATFKHYHNKSTSHSSVLQNLLTAPKVSDFNMKSFSLLQNLLKSPQVDKEQQANQSVGNDGTSTLLGSPQSKYSAILESLSRQVSISNQTGQSALGQIAMVSSDKCQPTSKSMFTDMTKSSSSKDLSNNLGQGLWNNEMIKTEEIFSSPNYSQILPISLSEGSSSAHLSQLSPPIIPTPPGLPLISPISPPPSADMALHLDNQNTHAPFSNLLRGLLSKINSKVCTNNPD